MALGDLKDRSHLADSIIQRSKNIELSPQECRRYHRQMILDPIGPQGQKRLKAARVLIVGVGGLGAPALLYLAGAGVGTIGLVDGDSVDLSNLHRQVLYRAQDIEKPKVKIAYDQARAQNPEVNLILFENYINSNNVQEVVSQFDLVIDGTDNFQARYLVSDQAVKSKIPYLYASISKFSGQFSVFYPPHGPCYRCLFPDPPPPGSIPNCSEAGVLGTVAGMLGTMQAHEALKLILGIGTSPLGKVMILDALTLNWRTFELAPDPDCPSCGRENTQYRPKNVVGSDLPHSSCQLLTPSTHLKEWAGKNLTEISAKDLYQVLSQNKQGQKKSPVLIDVRTEDERLQWGVIEGSHHVPLSEIEKYLKQIDEQTESTQIEDSDGLKKLEEHLKDWTDPQESAGLIIYCKTGPRSQKAQSLISQHLEKNGTFEGGHKEFLDGHQVITNIQTLKGGFLAWMEHTNEMVKHLA